MTVNMGANITPNMAGSLAPKVKSYRIISNQSIAENVFMLRLHAPDLGETCSPGTFVEVQLKDRSKILRRPISIHDWAVDAKELRLIYKVVGQGTKDMSEYQQGEMLNIIGPLGQGFPLPEPAETSGEKTCLLVGGGLGMPPLYELAKQLFSRGHQVIALLGFRSRNDVFGVEMLEKFGKVVVTTEDGSCGTAGRVDVKLKELGALADVYYACGPLPLLACINAELPELVGYLSFEAGMACGMGACYGCAIATRHGLRRVCKDGPVFQAGEVIVGGI